MTSRLLRSLDEEIYGSSDQIAADCARARKAAYLVRQGEMSEVNVLIAALHARYDPNPIAEISSWLHLVEGLACLYLGTAGSATDRFRRSLALARASGLQEMRALAAAWLAHVAYGSYEINELADRLKEALSTASINNHQALARAKLIGAVALHLSGRYDLAKPWYSDVRIHATAEGDDATMSALMHNIACMSVANVRQYQLDRGVFSPRVASPSALLGAEATGSYDELIGSKGLSTWVPILRAQAHSLLGNAKQALDIYEEQIGIAEGQGLSRVMGYMNADIAWCRASLGQLDQAKADAELAEQWFGAGVLVDDKAATHSRLAATYTQLGFADLANAHKQKADAAWNDFRQVQAQIVGAVSPLCCAG